MKQWLHRPALGTLVGVFEWQSLCINQFSGRITKARDKPNEQGSTCYKLDLNPGVLLWE